MLCTYVWIVLSLTAIMMNSPIILYYTIIFHAVEKENKSNLSLHTLYVFLCAYFNASCSVRMSKEFFPCLTSAWILQKFLQRLFERCIQIHLGQMLLAIQIICTNTSKAKCLCIKSKKHYLELKALLHIISHLNQDFLTPSEYTIEDPNVRITA